jgi:hypothetical protein
MKKGRDSTPFGLYLSSYFEVVVLQAPPVQGQVLG